MYFCITAKWKLVVKWHGNMAGGGLAAQHYREAYRRQIPNAYSNPNERILYVHQKHPICITRMDTLQPSPGLREISEVSPSLASD